MDIVGKQMLRANIYMGTVETWDLPSEPGCIAPAAKDGWVMALRNGIFRAKTWKGELTHLATLDYDPAHMRANDGKCDARGRFWIGTLDETKRARNAALCTLDCRGNTPVIAQHTDPTTLPVTTANGLAWSPDNRTLYWADTASHTVHAWDFDIQQSALSGHRRFAQFDAKPKDWQFDAAKDNGGYRGRPDGAAVDVQGNYFVAMFEGRRLCQFAPDGRLLAEWLTPAQCPTMPCFGGEDLKTLFITTARHGRSAAELAHFPQSGGVFSMRVEVAGLPANLFQD